MNIDEITYKIIQAAYNVHNRLGSGFLEKVYHNAMLIELDEMLMTFETEKPIKVHYKEQIVGEYFVDILVADCIIVELKAVENLLPIHEVQLVNYLNATGIDNGLLINFGSSVVVKRKYRKYNRQN